MTPVHIQCLGVFENMLSIRNSCTSAFAPCLSVSPHSEEFLPFISQNGGAPWAVLFSSGAQAGLVDISCCKQKPLTEKPFFSEWMYVPSCVRSLCAVVDALKKPNPKTTTNIFTNYILFLTGGDFSLPLHYSTLASDDNTMVHWYTMLQKDYNIALPCFYIVLKCTLQNTTVLQW